MVKPSGRALQASPEPPALSRPRPHTPGQGAEVIDLVRLPLGTRPTPMVPLDFEDVDRCRDLSCERYQACLAFCAMIRWKSFHCRQCPQRSAAVEEPKVRRPARLLALRP